MKKIENIYKYDLIGCILIALITAIIGFQIGKIKGIKTSESTIKLLNEKLYFYNSVDSLNLPTVVASLKKVNLDLNNVMGEVINISQLNNLNDSLIKLTKLQDLNINSLNTNFDKVLTEKDSLFEQLISLKKTIPILNSNRQNYKLKEGEGVYLVKNLISIGIENIKRSQVIFNINNKRDSLSVGNQLNINFGGINCILSLTLINKKDSLNPYCRIESIVIK